MRYDERYASTAEMMEELFEFGRTIGDNYSELDEKTRIIVAAIMVLARELDSFKRSYGEET